MHLNAASDTEQNLVATRLQSLYELIERLNSVYDLQELLEFLVDQALHLTGGRQGLLLLSDPHEPKLQQVAVVRGANLSKKQLKNPLEFAGTTIIEDILERGEPRLIVDLHLDEGYSGVTSQPAQHIKKARSILAVPLKVKAQLIGLIYIDRPKQAVFGQADLEFLGAFANQAALAIKRAHEHQRQVEDLTLLNKLSRSVVQVLDLNEVLSRIVQEANQMLEVETGSVVLLDEAQSELFFAISISEGKRVDISTRLQPDQGIVGWVISTGQPACVSDVSKDSRWYGEVETGFATRSLLCVPLLLNARVIGALQALNKHSPHGFNTSDVTRFSAFAASASIAIENARLFQEVYQADQLRALNRAALSLSSTLELETILNTGLEQAVNFLKAPASAISLVDGQVELPPIQVSRGLLCQDPAEAECHNRELDQLAALILNRGLDEAFVITDLKDFPELDLANLQSSGIQAVAMAPIKVGNKISGALIVMDNRPHSYASNEIGLLTSLAHIVGLAAQNAIHYNQARNQTLRLAYLGDIGTALTSTLDLKHVLKVIIEAVNALLETERTSVFLIDPDTNELVLHYSNEGNADIRLPAPWQGIAGWVATHDKPALVNNTRSDPRHLRQIAIETGYQAHSILCVPLKVKDQVIGVVEVLNQTSKQQFNHNHQILLTELTRWAAIAIHNARLFDERLQAYQRLASEQQRRIAAETRGAMASVILDMAHTMNNVVGAIRVWATSLENVSYTNPDLTIGEFQKEMSQIRRNAEEAIDLISKMTDPLKEATIAPTDVHICLTRAIKSCWWPDNVELKKAYGDAVPLVRANAKRLEAAFHNLLSNAIQAVAKSGGQVEIYTRRTADGWTEIRFADNGAGIPANLQDRIFHPGVSGKVQGLGIGLWLVQTFIEQFGGQIGFTSQPDTGTVFVVTLQSVEGETVSPGGHHPA